MILHYSLFASLPPRRRLPRRTWKPRRLQGRVLPGRVHRVPGPVRVPQRVRDRLRVHEPRARAVRRGLRALHVGLEAAPHAHRLCQRRSAGADAARFGKPDEQRTVDVGYRGRPLPAYLGRGGQEKELIGRRFAELPPGPACASTSRALRPTGCTATPGTASSPTTRAVLGVESGASAFDLEGEIITEYRELVARGVQADRGRPEDARRAGTASSTCGRSARATSRPPRSASARCSSRAATPGHGAVPPLHPAAQGLLELRRGRRR